ncbi:hypothetical protein Bp8pS_200 [Bacillus phage vB_BpuM-BpSp]|nr:hypothetical protein Bp8pS_200 [Bacillus phage vB_BpuM-BpSp]
MVLYKVNNDLDTIKEQMKEVSSLKQLGDKEINKEIDKFMEDTKETVKEIETELKKEKEREDLSTAKAVIKKLENLMEENKDKEDLVKRINEQIKMIEDSFKLDSLRIIRPTMKKENLVKNHLELRKKALNKLDKHANFRYLYIEDISEKVLNVLPEDLKERNVLLASYIYSFILTAPIKNGQYSFFINFLIKNINELDKEYEMKDEFTDNLINFVSNEL